MRRWRQSPAMAVAAIVVFFVIQLGLPVSRLGGDDVQRFGWQMYSDADPPISFTVVRESGEAVAESEVDLADYMAVVRLDIDLVAHIPEHICTVDSDVVRVVWDGGEYEC